jgi:hypothetical protein
MQWKAGFYSDMAPWEWLSPPPNYDMIGQKDKEPAS